MFLKKLKDYPVPGLVTVLPESINRAIPSYHRAFLTALAQKRAELGRKAKVCFTSLIGLAQDLTHDQIVDYSALERGMHVFKEWQSKESPALGAQSASPILVLKGEKDELVPYQTAKEAWMKSCSSGNEVHSPISQAWGHTAMVRASLLDWMVWVDGLFTRGKTARNLTCSLEIKKPFDLEHVRALLDVDSIQNKGDQSC
ncbi:hypothetical protein MAC_07789 [Metarhizium acridum CQMa 102]|uniref:Uncharacterized protein n=1 Tax=Metarhizium acridum (strain CQMa 102) TaxID=655827 RepID=E9ED41_METAQ|nr:uncharacterized protein MAC_07789 [Metarhizium acridum CQMa 102]EFY86197.1 hypothetical protein MAC_07789 [Metarhizium acridum CQMa 102]